MTRFGAVVMSISVSQARDLLQRRYRKHPHFGFAVGQSIDKIRRSRMHLTAPGSFNGVDPHLRVFVLEVPRDIGAPDAADGKTRRRNSPQDVKHYKMFHSLSPVQADTSSSVRASFKYTLPKRNLQSITFWDPGPTHRNLGLPVTPKGLYHEKTDFFFATPNGCCHRAHGEHRERQTATSMLRLRHYSKSTTRTPRTATNQIHVVAYLCVLAVGLGSMPSS